MEATLEPNQQPGEKLRFALIPWGHGAHSLQFSGFLYKFSERSGCFIGLIGLKDLFLYDLELKVEFLPAKDHGQIELPKLSREAE